MLPALHRLYLTMNKERRLQDQQQGITTIDEAVKKQATDTEEGANEIKFWENKMKST